jgi:hypothetical protein
MPVVKDKEFGVGGLNTRASSTGLPLLECTHLQDFRVVGTDWIQRLGISRVAQFGHAQSALTFTAASSMACANTVDARVWALGLYWTVEFAMQLTSASGTQGLVCVGSTTPGIIFDVTGGNIRARVWDSGGTPTSVTVGAASTSIQTVQLARSGATLTSRLDNGTAVTGSMSATLNVRTPVGDLRVARDDGTNYFGGVFDYLRAYTVTKANHNDRLVRNPCPRASYCVADYDFALSTGLLVHDRSRYENHLIAVNTPVAATSLCFNPAPVRGLSQTRDAVTNRGSLLVMSGGSYNIADLD